MLQLMSDTKSMIPVFYLFKTDNIPDDVMGIIMSYHTFKFKLHADLEDHLLVKFYDGLWEEQMAELRREQENDMEAEQLEAELYNKEDEEDWF